MWVPKRLRASWVVLFSLKFADSSRDQGLNSGGLFPFKKVKEFSVSVLFTCPQFRGNPLITTNLQEIRITAV